MSGLYVMQNSQKCLKLCCALEREWRNCARFDSQSKFAAKLQQTRDLPRGENICGSEHRWFTEKPGGKLERCIRNS